MEDCEKDKIFLFERYSTESLLKEQYPHPLFEIYPVKGSGYYSVILNIKSLYYMVKNKIEIPNRREILNEFKYASDLNKQYVIDYKKDSIKNIASYDVNRAKNSFWFYNNLDNRIRKCIYNYQLENIEWMINKECEGVSVQYDNQRFVSVINDLYFDKEESVFVFRELPEFCNVNIKGACLMDEMGIGKTLSVLSLISIKNEKPTLVITNNQICKHWVEEIKKFTNMSFITISSKRDFQKFSYKQIIETDVVIVSYEFLRNKIYKQRISNYEIKSTDPKQYIKSIEQMFLEIQLKNEDTSVPLNLVSWERIVLDESHSINYDVFLSRYLLSIPAKFRWLVSATPYKNLYSYIEQTLFLFDKYIGDKYMGYISFVMEQLDLFRKNTKQSVRAEMKLPEIKIEKEVLEFSETEKRIYDSIKQSLYNSYYYEEELRRMCCFPNLSRELKSIIKTFDSIEEVKTALLQNNEKIIEKMKYDLSIQNRNLNFTKQMLEDALDERQIERYNSAINKINEDITKIKKSIESCYRKSVYLTQTELPKSFKCPFCFEEKDNPVITICGHNFCEECSVQMINSIGSCGICRSQLNTNDIIKVNNNRDGNRDEYINRYGTKIAKIIEYLKSNKDEKIVIFSEWDELLIKLKQILEECGLIVFSCRGSVFQKNKSINDFVNNPSGCIILLSTTNSANGINLICSNKIIFLEPSKNSKDLEKQATARTNRIGQTSDTIVKYFIIKDTIEEEICSEIF